MGRLEGKVVLVTGGALGIGRAACLLLAREGATLAITDVLDDQGGALAAAIVRQARPARYWHLDVTREEEVARVTGEVEAAFGRLDVLVSNAGIAGADKPTDQLSEDEWQRVQAVNVKGVFLCTKHAVPALRRAGGGSIINLSSIYGIVGASGSAPYVASKGAVRLMTKTDALTYAKDGIRVNSVHPGFIWTPMVEQYLQTLEDPAAARGQLERLHPVGHFGEPDDVAYGILYLASDESKFVTGSELVIDGGYTAR
jgi:NAD(P)-dependent dehydrogenase (short-subunit alcohol dehydrogenase family)